MSCHWFILLLPECVKIHILWVSSSPQLNPSEVWVVKPRQEKDQKVFDRLGGGVLTFRLDVPTGLNLLCCADTWHLATYWHKTGIFSELGDMSWKTQSQTSLLFSSKSLWQMEGFSLSREIALPCPRWEQRLRSNGWKSLRSLDWPRLRRKWYRLCQRLS